MTGNENHMKYLTLMALLTLAGCAAASSPLEEDQQKRIGMPNPASAYCIEQGGRLEIRDGQDGDTGYCHLPDGRVVEEWELFRSQKQPDGER